jgi:ABC-type polysaccharide/polyol phosphate export permease
MKKQNEFKEVCMLKKLKSYLKTFWALLRTDFAIVNKNIVNDIIDVFIWISLISIVFTYIFPRLGMAQSFGALALVGTIASCGIFDIWGTTANYLSDLEGNNTNSYFFTLPIPSWMIFVKIALGQAYKTTILASFIIPLGKIILGNRLDLSNFAPLKFLLIFLTVNIFCGFFAILMMSITPSMKRVNSVWVRILFPLWFLGGAEFPWKVIQGMSEYLSYAILLNPILYCMEGIRATVLGQENYLNFWVCLIFLWAAGGVVGFIGMRRLKKNLDLV